MKFDKAIMHVYIKQFLIKYIHMYMWRCENKIKYGNNFFSILF